MEQQSEVLDPDNVEVLDDEAQTQEGLDAVAQELAQAREHVKAVSAEFENFRRRQQEEQKRRQVLMKEELFRELLPLVDNLDRSLDAARQAQGASPEALLKGVELIRRSFDRLMENHEVVAIPTDGASFDPTLHEAMMVEERDDVDDQTIVQELQKGYKMGDRVLRPAMVKVARKA